MKTNQFFFAALIAAFLSGASFSAAQVTMGGSVEPTKGAILDLNSTTKGGLLLSNVELTALNDIPTSFPNASAISNPQLLAGMIVWNTNDYLAPNGDGLYLWDGNKWNYTGGSDGLAILLPVPLPAVTISAPSCLSADFAVTFSQYNLGADTTKFNSGAYAALSPAKRQIRYLADCTHADAVNVWGDLYQWGRVADGHEKRTSENFPTNDNSTQNGAISDVDDNGQPSAASGAVGKFIKHNSDPRDWRTPKKDDLLGNGQLVNYDFGSADGGAVPDGLGGFYQKPVKTVNDPCPFGWRIPTQDEWERLGNYDCKPNTTGGNITTIPLTGQTTTTRGTGNELTWISVEDGKVSTNWSGSDWRWGGQALYKASDWTAATTEVSGYFYNVNWSSTDKKLYDAAAPEPLLFLPAAGFRLNGSGSFSSYGLYGYYWCSTVTGNNSVFMQFYNNAYFGTSLYRAYGCSVRCVAE